MERLKNITVWLFVALFVASLFLNVRHYTDRRTDGVVCDTTRVTVVDTIPYHEPKPKEEKQVGTVTDRLALAKPQKSGNNTSKNIPVSGNIDDKNIPMLEEMGSFDKEDNFPTKADSVDVEIPITQKVYEDSTYRAVISGYKVSLDELLIFPKQEVVTIKQTPKPKRWSIGIQVGYGMTLKGTPQFAPYIGVGIQYNLFSF